MDESGFPPSDNSKCYVVGTRGKKNQYMQGGANRENVTAIVTICADGSYIKPLVIFKGQNIYSKWLQNNVINANCTSSPNGWTDSQIALMWFKDHFEPETREKAKGRLRVLLLDNHKSHYSLELLEEAVKHNITILGYPPHWTHALQGLDVVCFAKMKHNWRHLIREFESTSLHSVGKQNFLELFGAAFLLSFSKETVLSAFKVTGIHPFSRNIISPDQMKPSEASSTSTSFPLPLNTPVHRIMAAFRHQPPMRFDVDIATHLPAPNFIPLQPSGNTTGQPNQYLLPSVPVLNPTLDPSDFSPTKRVRSVYASLATSKSASFLVNDRKLTSSDTLPAPVLERPPTNTVPDWKTAQECLERLSRQKLEDDITKLTETLRRAQIHSKVCESIAEGAQAQLVLASMHNAKLQVALHKKEAAKTGDNFRLGDGMPRIWTSEESREEIKAKQETKEREEAETLVRKENARKKKTLSEAVEKEWKQLKAYHKEEVAKWEAKCSQWEREGFPKKFWEPKPTRPTKKQLQEQLLKAEEDAEITEEVTSDVDQ
ncbi:hypothetical protein ACEPAF_7078 [Sanghuangporus sanghuang]